MGISKKTEIFTKVQLSLIFKCIPHTFLFAALVFNTACDKAQTANANNPNDRDVSGNQSLSERSIKSFEITNRKVADKFSGVSKEEALSIAEKAFEQEYHRKSSGDIVICERLMFWSVIYEDSGDEYSISKGVKGRQDDFNINVSRWKKKLPVPAEIQSPTENISISKAVIIAKDKFGMYLKSINGGENEVNLVMPVTCEMKRAWRIYLVDKVAWETGVYANSDLPDYLIDKKTGEILYDSKGRQR